MTTTTEHKALTDRQVLDGYSAHLEAQALAMLAALPPRTRRTRKTTKES